MTSNIIESIVDHIIQRIYCDILVSKSMLNEDVLGHWYALSNDDCVAWVDIAVSCCIDTVETVVTQGPAAVLILRVTVVTLQHCFE